MSRNGGSSKTALDRLSNSGHLSNAFDLPCLLFTWHLSISHSHDGVMGVSNWKVNMPYASISYQFKKGIQSLTGKKPMEKMDITRPITSRFVGGISIHFIHPKIWRMEAQLSTRPIQCLSLCEKLQ